MHAKKLKEPNNSYFITLSSLSQQRCSLSINFVSFIWSSFSRLALPRSDFPGNAHGKKHSLQASCDNVHEPAAPLRSFSHGQTNGPNKGARGLNAHHRNAQTSNMLEFPCGPKLGKVLQRSEDSSLHTQEVCPPAC